MPVPTHATLILLLCAACASPAGKGGSARTRTQPRSRATAAITRAEIDASTHWDAYALVEAVRPRWLRAQNTEYERVLVVVGTVELGAVESLRQIPLNTVESIEFHDAFDLTQTLAARYAGTIRVVLRTRK